MTEKEKAKKLYGNGITKESFPELKESKDKKIREAILNGLIDCRDAPDLGWSNFGGIHIDDCIDWLEKQGEQEEPQVYETEDGKIITYSETDGYKFVEPNFHEGDWVVNKFGDSWHIDSLDKKNYQVSDGKGNYNYFPISKQDEMHLWTIQDAKDGDVLVHSSFMFDDFIFIYNNTSILQAYCYYSNKRDRFIIEDRGHHCPWNMQEVTPATKEQRDLLFQKIKEAGYKWNTETKTLEKLIKPKFDPKTLKPFDKVLCWNGDDCVWECDFFSYYKEDRLHPCVCVNGSYICVIPYNDKTQKFAGTSKIVPEYYRYWEE